MTKIKYHLNAKTLKIERVKVSKRQRIKQWLSASALGLVLAAVLLLLGYRFISSPREKMLEREIEQYKLQYKILNDRVDHAQAVINDLADRDNNIYRVIFEAEPIPVEKRMRGYVNESRYEDLKKYRNSDIVVNTYRKLDAVVNQIYMQSKSYDQVFKLAKDKEKMLASIPAIRPVDFKDLRRIGSFFGYRTDPFYKVPKFHYGLDFTAAVGTPIYATGDGVVESAEYNTGGYGVQLVINHGFGYKTLYAHLSKFLVQEGQKVVRGQKIALMGNTGKSTAPHLHYEVIKNGTKINPIDFFFNDITPEEYSLMLDASKHPSQTMD